MHCMRSVCEYFETTLNNNAMLIEEFPCSYSENSV